MLKALALVALVSAALFAAALIGLMVGYSWQPPTQETEQQNPAENKSEQNDRESQKAFWQKVTTDPVAAFTLWLVIFTAVLGGTSIFQLASLNRAEITSAKAANAAKESAEAASRSVASYVDSERGDIVNSTVELVQAQPNDPNPTIKYTFLNIGRGAAKVLEISIECYFGSPQLPTILSFDPTKTERFSLYILSGVTVGTETKPIALKPCSIPDQLTPADYAFGPNKVRYLMVKGFVRYETLDASYKRTFGWAYGATGPGFSPVIPWDVEEREVR